MSSQHVLPGRLTERVIASALFTTQTLVVQEAKGTEECFRIAPVLPEWVAGSQRVPLRQVTQSSAPHPQLAGGPRRDVIMSFMVCTRTKGSVLGQPLWDHKNTKMNNFT